MEAKGTSAAVRGLPKELVAAIATIVAVLAVAGVGALLSSALPAGATSGWMLIGSYLAPAAVIFVGVWLWAQRD